MKSIHQCLCQKYQERPFESFGCLDGQESFLRGVYGKNDSSMIALGESWDGLLFLGVPTAVWDGREPTWSFNPIWQIPEEWGFELNDLQEIELLHRAEEIANRANKNKG